MPKLIILEFKLEANSDGVRIPIDAYEESHEVANRELAEIILRDRLAEQAASDYTDTAMQQWESQGYVFMQNGSSDYWDMITYVE